MTIVGPLPWGSSGHDKVKNPVNNHQISYHLIMKPQGIWRLLLFTAVLTPSAILWSIGSDKSQAEVIVYPAADGSPLSTDYQCTVDGRNVPVYTAGVETRGSGNQNHPYYFCYFDLSGKSTIRVRSSVYPLNKAILEPDHDKVAASVEADGSLTFSIEKPMKVTVMPKAFDELLRVLHIFVNPIEPVPEGPKVTVLSGCPPVRDRIYVRAGETLYIAGGAFIRANVSVTGAGARVMGRGIIDFSTWSHFAGPSGEPFSITGEDTHKPVMIEGVILRHGWRATISTRGRGIRLDNVKIVSSSVINDDPIWNSASDVTIRDMFIRGDDDCIGIKGNGGDVRNVSVRNCQLWSDRARNIIFGPESRGDVIENIEFVNLDLYRHMAANDNSKIKSIRMEAISIRAGGRSLSEPQRVKNVLFENINIRCENYNRDGPGLLGVHAVVAKVSGVNAPGTVDGPIVFHNIDYIGTPQARVTIDGYDEDHLVQNVTIADLCRNGTLVTRESLGVFTGKYGRNIQFTTANQRSK